MRMATATTSFGWARLSRWGGALALLGALLLASCSATAKVPKPTLTRHPTATATPQAPAQTVFAGDGNGNVYALSAVSGAVEWTYPLGSDEITDLAVYALSPGLSYLYAVTQYDGIYGLNIHDGTPIWHFGASRGTTVLLGDQVVCIDDYQGVYLLNALTGDMLKFFPMPNARLLALSKHVLYVTWTSDKITTYLSAISLLTGAPLWKTQVNVSADQGAEASVNQLAEGNGLVYIETTTKRVAALNEQTGALVWNTPTSALMNTIALQGANIYAGGGSQSAHGQVDAFNALTGALLWKTPVDGQPFAFQGTDPSVIYVGTNDYGSAGYIYAIAPASGAITWRSSSLGAIKYVPNERIALDAGTLYVGFVGAVGAFQASSGRSVWQFPLPQGGATYSTAIG